MSERVPAGGPYRAAIGLHEGFNLEHLSEARKILSTYCGSGRGYCCTVISMLERIAPLVARARLEDLAGDSKYEGLDKEVIELFSGLLEFYSGYISGLLLGYAEDVIVRVREAFRLEGHLLYPGEYVRLTPGKAAALTLAGLVEPGRATAFKAAQECNSVEEG
ncbi:MAG: hypothetical protein F7C35_06930 [Desulfurococcales archaeon]|nr:hypothetical protein [Desulfurococcales archaeon]